MHFILRPWNINDIESLAEYGNNPNIAASMTDQFPHPYRADKAKAFIEQATRSTPNNILAIEVEGKAAGGIGVHLQQDVYRKNAELGYWLAEQYWGKGIMTKVIREMVDYAFKNFDITRIYARPYGTNTGSQKALEKAGFKFEAKLEKTIFKNEVFLDELIYAVRR